ncbi:GNAT family N-acetyltransferase [Haliea sp. E1-2-M8]|uniref:GNAT family N-acetyltransferase n=1 Tax=Haliea sp. E1-2-M8 TaxID=3064706 RepID=UPI00271BFF22|nr:GNAT family N-acetyltransferase [Haliea sp. E1-2-M8]MDO8860267.1 GNAT family N-acetyltransferase [Haliea sp. E1-2-M8]
MLQTERLTIEPLTLDDAPFILALLNDPDFIAQIADRGVRDEAAARRYLEEGPLASYRQHGFGLWAVRLRGGDAIGVCGLLRRETLADVDIGYALLPQARGRGFAREAAQAVVLYARETLGLARLVAVVAPGNAPSRALLASLGFGHESTVQLTSDAENLCLYGWDASEPVA